ncbi:MAG: N-6 DNA methylase [Nitrososphaerota archaeon]|jgi:23S rRNA G2445 N2-methylase RlmL|nr:N-6 DNA methylase [Nitrososphaerota archaeon]
MEEYVLGCCKGLERSSELELESLGYSVVRTMDGLVVFRTEERLSDLDAKHIRTAEWLSLASALSPGQDEPNTPMASAEIRGREGGLASVFTRASDLAKVNSTTQLWKRDYRRFNHPSAIMPSTAASLLLLTRMDGDLLDPFVGGGTIVIEDRLYLKEAGLHSKIKFGIHRTAGIDINSHHLSGARKNAKFAGVDGELDLLLADSTRYEPDHEFNRIVTNPPYGVRGAKKARIILLYRRLAGHIDKLLSHPGEGVVATTESSELNNFLEERGYRTDSSLKIRHRKLWVGIVRFWL